MSAVVSVQDVVINTLKAHAPLSAFLRVTTENADKRIYDGDLAPPNTALWTPDVNPQPWPYICVSGGTEIDLALFCNADFFEDTVTARVWVPGPNHRLAKLGYLHLRAALIGPWPVTGGYAFHAHEVTLEQVLTDPDLEATQAVARILAHAEAVV